MTTILDTVVEYEGKLIDLVGQAKDPVVEYVTKGVELAEGHVPDVTYPTALPTPLELVETQATFAKRLVDANADLWKAVFTALAPVAGYPVSVKRAKAKADKATATTTAAA